MGRSCASSTEPSSFPGTASLQGLQSKSGPVSEELSAPPCLLLTFWMTFPNQIQFLIYTTAMWPIFDTGIKPNCPTRAGCTIKEI